MKPDNSGRSHDNSLMTTPMASRRHIAIFGATNAGKSTLFNLLLGQEMSIVSSQHGTTTDPVIKSMELLGYGPIALIDTAGLNDRSELGSKRVHRSRQMLSRADAAIYVADAANWLADPALAEDYKLLCEDFGKQMIPHQLILSKADSLAAGQISYLKQNWPHGEQAKLILDLQKPENASLLFPVLSNLLQESDEMLAQASSDKCHGRKDQVSESVIEGLVDAGDTVLMIVPIDSEAPKGRLILPQVQLIRDCLDHGVKCIVCRDDELADTISEYGSSIKLAVTDSQAFALAASLVPEQIPLTSFSMLLAAVKGDFPLMLAGLRRIRELRDGDTILISEACSHNSSHEDIGKIKLPTMLRKLTGAELNFEFSAGHSYPDDLGRFSLVVHCGGCMLTHRSMLSRVRYAADREIAITNYGLLLAYGNGIIKRSTEIFRLRRQLPHELTEGI
ncbi:MAG: [FeFe] hydrogenase H-cluster maturation GTPase HydF [Clostridiaceae bacterium]|nr:[FeFe] hydrogenase H-cluster maturation GTPase HydF [Clostridiaceae bacterium]